MVISDASKSNFNSGNHWVERIRQNLPMVALADDAGSSSRSAAPATAVDTDVRLLGALLGQILVEHQGEAFYVFIEKMRKASRRARRNEVGLGFEALEEITRDYTLSLEPDLRVNGLQNAAEAFRLFLTLTGIAEEYHQSRRFEQDEQGLASLISHCRANGLSCQTLLDAIGQQPLRLVATAHPTTILRYTLLNHQRDIYRLLQAFHAPQLTGVQQQDIVNQLAEKIEVLWATHFGRWVKPTVNDEIQHVLGHFKRTLYPALPAFHKKLENLLHYHYSTISDTSLSQTALLPAPVVTLGSWVGGDMDGNPFVTADLFSQAIYSAYREIIKLYYHEIEQLAPRLSHAQEKVPASLALLDSIAKDIADMKADKLDTLAQEALIPREPHRLKLSLIAQRLDNTLVQKIHMGIHTAARFVYYGPQPVLADLDAIISSYQADGYQRTITQRLRTFKQKVMLFGFHFAGLDLREDTQNVNKAAQCVLGAMDLNKNVPPDDADALTQAVLSPTVLASRTVEQLTNTMDDLDSRSVVQRLLDILVVVNRTHRYVGVQACTRFILSMTGCSKDVLNALLLLKTQGLFYRDEKGKNQSTIDIVPLFETIADLKNAPSVMENLFQNKAYCAQLACRKNMQIIMVGYSDSNKDGGYFSSNWHVYQAQKKLLAVAARYGISLRFFHGRGGSIGRGGGPANRAIWALPTNSGRYGQELTEQGEVLSRYYNAENTAVSHIENMFCALLEKNMADASAQDDALMQEWEAIADSLSQYAYTHYKLLVHESPAFMAYFESATPHEIELVNIGSRPARRRTLQSVKDLRAIPWVFRWYQSRQILPGWYGLGTALSQWLQAQTSSGLAQLRRMYSEWPFFKSLLENSEIALRQTDLRIARYYASLMPDTIACDALFKEIEAEYERTLAVLAQITGTGLLGRPEDEALRNSIALKEPYLDPLNFIQVKLLAQYRQESTTVDAREAYHQAIISSIEGIATGLGTTG